MKQKSELRKINGHKVLYVDGNPFIILSFQLNCDSCYDAGVIDRLLKNVARIGANSVALLLYWRLIEPNEGEYDFSILEAMIDSADRYGLKIVLVWFGTYKNSTIHYAPDWVVEDETRFTRVMRKDRSMIRYVACQNCKTTLDKDAQAVEHVFSYLREYDKNHTVILFQVNNETGILGGTVRCHCDTCNQLFYDGEYIEKYSERAEEVFSAESNLRFQETIAARARAIYDIPCYMNAWLHKNIPNDLAGVGYPSGGPVRCTMDIFLKNKKAIDFIAPDIYMTGYRDFMRICSEYKSDNNPLYIAEHGLGKNSRAYKNVYYGIGEFSILGFDPWAIDCSFPNVTESPLVDMVTERWNDEAYDMSDSYIPINQARVLVAENMGTSMLKYWVQEEGESNISLSFDDVNVLVTYQGAGSCDGVSSNNPKEHVSDSRGIVIRLDNKKFLTLGCNSFIQFVDANGELLEIKRSERGHYEGYNFICEAKNTISFGTKKVSVWQINPGVCLTELI